jgi:hypothetical protein
MDKVGWKKEKKDLSAFLARFFFPLLSSLSKEDGKKGRKSQRRSK